jgi:hypothetical protein
MNHVNDTGFQLNALMLDHTTVMCSYARYNALISVGDYKRKLNSEYRTRSHVIPVIYTLTLRHQKMTLANVHCEAEKMKHHLKSSTKNMQNNGWPFKSHVFCRVH